MQKLELQVRDGEYKLMCSAFVKLFAKLNYFKVNGYIFTGWQGRQNLQLSICIPALQGNHFAFISAWRQLLQIPVCIPT